MNKLLKYIILFLLLLPVFTTAAEKFEYSDIKNCYFRGNSEQVAKSTIKQTGKNGCLQLDTSRQYTVDLDKLKSSNSCEDGYELYSVSQKMLDDNGLEWDVFGYGCRKPIEYTSVLYCQYAVSHAAVMLIYKNNEVSMKIHDRVLNDPVFEYDNSAWYEKENITFEIKHTNKYSNGVLSDCPAFVAEKFENNSSKVIGYYFFDENKDNLWEYYLEKKEEVSESVKDDIDNNYHQIFHNNNVCKEADEWQNSKMCVYEDSANKTRFKIYMKPDTYRLASDYEGSTIYAKFTFNELLSKNNGNCPTKMYYWWNGTLLYVALEDINNSLYIRYKAPLILSTDKVTIPSYCDNDFDISLTPDSLDCVGILGRPDDNISKPPAFYLQTAFTVMKYVAIVIVIVFTIMDYTGAVSSQDDDAIKKATSKLVTRLIICVILFVLPTLIEFLFKILDIYGDAAHCKIN